MNKKDIIVGVDFSEASKAALKEAGQIATARQGWLDIVHVIDIEFFEREIDEKYLTIDQLKRHAEDALQDFALKALESPPSLRFRVLVGHPFEELFNQTKSPDCDLLVLGSYGNNGKPDRVGNTAARFVRKAPVPVLLVRENPHPPFKSIIACHDFSETSQRAAEYAAELANLHQATLYLLHIQVRYPNPYPMIYPELPVVDETCFSDQLESNEGRLEDIGKRLKVSYPKLDVRAVVMRGDSVAAEIFDYAKSIDADFAVLGTRGRTGLKKLLLGTTAERIIHKCPCSVLAVKPVDFEG